ncbi:MAG TPA: PDZ domain-containing protein [Candidatus Margulisiibacteriota bacterium]|nr:PDZ domain-containing protein [Candidatus Margulisiibacteriota bacterium]
MISRRVFLLGILIGVGLVIQGWAFLSRPKLAINKSSLFEKEVSEAVAATVTIKEDAPVLPEKVEPVREEEKVLALELLGTVIGNPKDPIAYIKDLQLNKQGIYRLGSKVQEAKLVKIVMGEVTVEKDGKQQVIKLSKRARMWAGTGADNSVISMDGDQIIVSRNGILKEAKNLLNVLPQVKIKPYYEAKKVSGVMVQGIPEDSIISAAGIHNNDVVKMVNDQKINSYQKALQVFSKVRNQPEIRVTLLREGRIQNLNYRIGY